ncbi:O-antigen ligase family protein [Arcobacter sp.]|uniref:O-antigen ligase family protein n=1 Tax=Arcobacter sp. TaxID=1872629 RepID=UPI003D0BECF3
MNLILNRAILFFVGLLVFILPIAHTIAVRNISILILIFLTIYILLKNKTIKFNISFTKEIKNILFILIIFTTWLYFIAFFISNETSWTVGEIKSQWITPLSYFITFGLLSVYFSKESKDLQKNFYSLIFLMLFVHVLYVDLYALKYYIQTKSIISRFSGLTEGPDKSNYITNVLLAFLVSEVIYRFRTSKRVLNINNFVLLIIILLTLLSSIFEGMRNGVVAIIFLTISGLFFSFYNNDKYTKKFKFIISFGIFILLTFPAMYNFKNDKRWDTLIQTIPYALDTKTNKNWLNNEKYKRPVLPNGESVETSAYLRIAWGYEGLKLIYENPFGIGYGRNAFSHGLQIKYGDVQKVGHSHSGFIDLAIGIGIPGLIIWLSFGIYLMYVSYTFFMKYNSFYALILFFNVSGFFARFIVDSNMRDHMFQTFMLIIGFSFIFMLKDKYQNEELNNK